MQLGIVGTGHIASAIVEGLCSGGGCPFERIVLSPRNRERAEALAARFPTVAVGSDNQAALEHSAMVLLSVRPPQAEQVLRDLRFDPAQVVVSLIATLPLARVCELVAPATAVQRAVPLPTVARRNGPVAVHPPMAATRALWQVLGGAAECASEHEFETLWSVTGLVSPYYALLEEIHRWCADNGVDPEVAAAYVASLFASLALQASPLTAGEPYPAFANLARGAQTPGGLNEQAMGILARQGGHHAMVEALVAIRARLAAASAPSAPSA